MCEAVDKDGRPIRTSATVAQLDKEKKRAKKRRGFVTKALVSLGVLKDK